MNHECARIATGLQKYLRTELRHFCRRLPYCDIGASRKEVDEILDGLIAAIDYWHEFYPSGEFLLDDVFGNEDGPEQYGYGEAARKENCHVLDALYNIAKIIDYVLRLEMPSPTVQKFQTLHQKLQDYGVST